MNKLFYNRNMTNMFDIERIGGKQSLIGYSLEEQYTGQKWIDGRKIYQKTWKVDKLPAANSVKDIDISSLNFATVITMDGTFCNPVNRETMPCSFF